MEQRATFRPGIDRRAPAMRIVFAVALSFCAFLAALAAPSGGPSPAASRPAVSPLHGTVLDSGGSGIADARVEALRADIAAQITAAPS